MAKARNLTNERYGQLVVIAQRGHVRYGGRSQLQWLCRCNCGEELVLPAAKLPYSPASERAATRAGRLIYTCCETCRMKTCEICGSKFPHSHTSYVCPSPLCQNELQRERDAFWHRAGLDRYRSDDEFRAKWNKFQNEYYARHAEQIQESRRKKLEQMPAEKRVQLEQRKREQQSKRYQAMKADPQKYERHLARGRERINERAAREFLRTADEIAKRVEDDTEENNNDKK